jgi:ABC-2 type transport system ATP-binding protein
MQVQEYLDFMAQLRGLKGSKKKQAIQEALESTGLIDRRFQVIQTLSKGYRQRVGLAQAILHKPKILILDEPTNGLDPVQILEIRDLIRRLAKETTILVSTHILSEIEAVCDRVIILIDGYLVEDQPLDTLLGQGSLYLAIRPKTDQNHSAQASIDSIQNEATSILNQLEGIESIQSLGEQNGFFCYQIQGSDAWDSHAQLINHLVEHQWEIGQMNHKVKSLEGVFRDLMADHIKTQTQTQTQQVISSSTSSPVVK